MKICLKCAAPLKATGWRCSLCGWTPDYRNGIPLLAPELAKGAPDYPLEAHYRCARLENTHFWFTCRNQIITHFLDLYFKKANNLLEIGCGTGYVLNGISTVLPGLQLCGGEAYPSVLKYAKTRLPKAEWLQMDAYRLPYIEEFGVVAAFDVLEHLANDEMVLKKMHRATIPGGGIMITVPQHPWLWSALDEQSGHKRRYTRAKLKDKVQDAGFKVQFITSFVTLLLPLMLMSRLKKKRLTQTSASQCELNIPKPLNTVFKLICSFEVALIKKGLCLPAGGSLLCIAKKKGLKNE